MSTRFRVPDINWHLRNLCKRTFYNIWSGFNPYVSIKGINIPINRNFSIPMLESLREKTYEYGELNIIEKTLNKTDLVLEFGTGLGLISAFCAKKIGTDHVFTIEANKNLKKQIEKLYHLNNIQPNIEFGLAGLSNNNVTFYYEPKDIWSSSTLKLSTTSKTVSVKEINCNDLLKKLKPNYLIMDIEGGEYLLLPKLNLDSVNKLQIELHSKLIGDAKIDELKIFLGKNNFKLDTELSGNEQYFFYK